MTLEGVLIALRSIWSNKLRSFLSVLGNIVAITALVVVVAIIQGLDAAMEKLLLARGADVFSVEAHGAVFSEEEWEQVKHRPPISMEDARAIERGVTTAGHLLISDNRMTGVRYRDRKIDAIEINGRSEDYAYFEETDLDRGRHYTALETRRRTPVAVLGWETAERLFPDREALDQQILIEGRHYRVIGVMKKRGALLGISRDQYVIIPIDAMEKQWGKLRWVAVQLKPRTPEEMSDCAQEVRTVLRAHRGLRPREPDNFDILAAATWLKMYRDSTRALSSALIGLVALALVVGGIVIANIMLMVVTERTREIGIRKAIGAKRAHILWQFLAESSTLSLVGGLIGLGIGGGIAALVDMTTPLPCRIEPWSVAVGLGMVLAVGIGAGLYPAMRAAFMDPIVALRNEK